MTGEQERGEGQGQDLTLLIADAMADPMRSRIFFALAEPRFFVTPRGRGDTPLGLSVRQISTRLHESPRKVRYHLDSLVEQGLVELVDEKGRRGVVEHFFLAAQSPHLTTPQIKDVSRDQQQKVVLAVLKAIFADATIAVTEGTFVQRPSWTTVRIRAEVDEQGWKELASLHERAIVESEAVVLRSIARLKSSCRKPISITSANLCFETPCWPGPAT